MSSITSVQFSSNRVCAVKSIILPNIKCPQLMKPKGETVARNPNSLSDRNGVKTSGETRLSWEANSPLVR